MCVWIFPCAQFQKTMDLFTDRTACNGEESQTGHRKPGLSPVPLLNPQSSEAWCIPKCGLITTCVTISKTWSPWTSPSTC